MQTLQRCGQACCLVAVALPQGRVLNCAGHWEDIEAAALPVTDNWVGCSLSIPILNSVVPGALRSLLGNEQDHQHQALPHR